MTKPSLTTAQAADQLTRNSDGWGTTTVTYAYRDAGSGFYGETLNTLNSYQIGNFEKAIAYWEAACGINFVRVDDGDGYSNDATILIGGTNQMTPNFSAYEIGLASATEMASSSATGDIWLNFNKGWAEDGSYLWHTLTDATDINVAVHELGHALGLSHPGHYDSASQTEFSWADDAEYVEDSQQYTAMSYFPPDPAVMGSQSGDFSGFYPWMPMLHDIAAGRLLYGENSGVRSGNTVYGYDCSMDVAGTTFDLDADIHDQASAYYAPIWCIVDSGGIDEIDCTGSNYRVLIDLQPEHFSTLPGAGGTFHMKANVSIATGTIIENATGSAYNDTLIGNDAANQLAGGGGNDILIGGIGKDTISGGGGHDIFKFLSLADSLYGATRDVVNFSDGNYFDLDGVDANSNVAGDQDFIWIGTNTFSGVAGQLRYVKSTHVINGDVNGDGNTDFQIDYVSGATLQANDFSHF